MRSVYVVLLLETKSADPFFCYLSARYEKMGEQGMSRNSLQGSLQTKLLPIPLVHCSDVLTVRKLLLTDRTYRVEYTPTYLSTTGVPAVLAADGCWTVSYLDGDYY